MAAAAPNTGKTIAGFARVLVGGANLSGDARTIEVGVDYDAAAVEGMVASTRENLLDAGKVTFGPLQAVWSNTASAAGFDAGIQTQLLAIAAAATHGTAVIGIRAIPDEGNPAFSCVIGRQSHKAQSGRGAVMLDASFEAIAGQTVGTQAKCWGTLIAPGTDISATTTFDYIDDNGAGSTAGAWAVLHLTAPSTVLTSNNWAVTVEHSPDHMAWATLLTFTLTGATLTSEAKKATGSVDRYIRCVATKTAGNNIRPWVNFIRL